MPESARPLVAAALVGQGGAATGTVLSTATILAAWNVQGDPARSSVVADVDRLLAVRLPVESNTARRAQSVLALWLGPRSWLLIESGAGAGPSVLVDFEAQRDVLNAGGGALFDVSAGRVAFTVRGKRAETVLATGCPLDVDVRSFPPGHCAQSVFGRTAALYYRHEATPAFTVMVARSLAADVWHGLCVAASTDGYEVGLPAAFDPA